MAAKHDPKTRSEVLAAIKNGMTWERSWQTVWR